MEISLKLRYTILNLLVHKKAFTIAMVLLLGLNGESCLVEVKDEEKLFNSCCWNDSDMNNFVKCKI